jgi:lipopolysaccharide export system protein LptA
VCFQAVSRHADFDVHTSDHLAAGCIPGSTWRSVLRHTLAAAAAIAACTSWATIGSQAQTPAFKEYFGFLVENRVKPLEIEADLAEPEIAGVERYGGNTSRVAVKLGGVTIRSRSLTVVYERSAPTTGATTADLRKAGLVHILTLEASGGVLLTYQDQTAPGDKAVAVDEAVFDIRANTVTFTGNVKLTGWGNRIEGRRLVADLTKGFLIFPGD